MFFAILYVIPIILFKKLNQAMAGLNGKQLVNMASWLRLFNWGKQGECLQDNARALSLYLSGNKQLADKLLNGWLEQKIPQSIKNHINETRLHGYLWTWDWPQIISDYESLQKSGQAASNRLNFYASRAYSERGQFKESARCLNDIKYPKSTTDIYALATTLLPFYCLTGANEQAAQLIQLMDAYKYNLPSYIKNYWLGRSAVVNNEIQKAQDYFDAAIKDAANSPAWQKRINEKRNSPNSPALINGGELLSVEPTWQKLKSAISAQELISPTSGYGAVTLIVVSIALVFLVTNSYSLFPSPLTRAIELNCYNNGMLVPASVFAGEYWRLFTFLFLHAHLMHLLLNVIALFWLGKVAEKIYGMPSFLCIYFLSGILSGVVSIAFAPDLAAIGASGAIMGIFGAVSAGIFRLKNFLPASIRKKQLTLMIGLLVFQLIIDQIIPHIDVAAHLGGLITGIALGLLLPIPLTRTISSPQISY